MKNLSKLAGLFVGLTLMASCEKEDPIIPNEEELITTLIYTLVSQSSGDTVELKYQDLDGPGGDSAIVTGGTLQASETYTGTVLVLNEQELPPEDITEEVKEEDEEHQFFFLTDGMLNATIMYSDSDANGNPVGVETTLTAGSVSNGELTIILRHEPDKNASGVSDGDITNAGGETDIEVTFDVDVQ